LPISWSWSVSIQRVAYADDGFQIRPGLGPGLLELPSGADPRRSAGEETMSELFLGTSSWSTKGWVGPFYPVGTKPADYLAHYATQFRVVEADVTYYRIPTPSMVGGWRDRTPDDFSVCAKFPRSIVHAGAGPRPDAGKLLLPEHVQQDTDLFCEAMAELGSKCGPLLLQFPYFNKSAFPDVEIFLERLDRFLEALPKEFRYAVEVRNQHWLDERLTALLRRRDVSLTLVEMSYMPHPADVSRHLDVVTSDVLYGRLIGDRKAVEARTKVFDEVVVDQSPSLARWAALMGALSERVTRTYLFANNHYAGHGPATIRELGRMLEESAA
jgi:uncharacterized protein YecE (DUF72 family)